MIGDNIGLVVRSVKMLATVLISTFLFAAQASPLGPQQISLYNSRIVGGRNSTIKEFPYQISLEFFSRFTCGGSILSPYYVLTAAHCVHERGPESAFVVRAGSSYRAQGGSEHKVAEVHVHEKYYVNEYQNTGFDVAVLKLRNPIAFDETRQPIELFEDGRESKPGALATASGWGRLKHQGSLPDQLQSVELAIVGKEDCLEVYKDLGGLEEGEICAGYVGSDVQSVCNGDSGGPLVIDGKLAGIAAHAEDCGNLKYPSAFTEVAHFRKWIDKRVKY